MNTQLQPNVKALFDRIIKAIEPQQPPALSLQLRVNYLINQVKQSLVIDLIAEDDLSAWNESQGFLTEFCSDDAIHFSDAQILESQGVRYTTTDIFFTWRQ